MPRRSSPIIRILADVIARRARGVDAYCEPALLRDMLQDGLAQWRTTDVSEADDEHGYTFLRRHGGW